jgi:hypothetical protein
MGVTTESDMRQPEWHAAMCQPPTKASSTLMISKFLHKLKKTYNCYHHVSYNKDFETRPHIDIFR